MTLFIGWKKEANPTSNRCGIAYLTKSNTLVIEQEITSFSFKNVMEVALGVYMAWNSIVHGYENGVKEDTKRGDLNS